VGGMAGLRPLSCVVAVAVCLGAAACGGTSSGSVTGSGNVVSRDISVASFSRLEVGSAFEVRMSVGAADAVTVHVDDNLVDQLDVGVSGDTLHVKMKSGTSVSDATLKADVVVRALKSADASGASNISLVDQIETGKLSLTLSGASGIAGRIKTSDGHLEASGASHARLSGSATNLNMTASGTSRLEAADLTVKSLVVQLSGASSAAVRVTDTISAELSGASALRYGGSPRFTRNEISGASSISPL
jgi:hypothetical protein